MSLLSEAWKAEDEIDLKVIEFQRVYKETLRNYRYLAARYDDALKRINDLEAELEHLRREVNR